jgi:hypothetical protein
MSLRDDVERVVRDTQPPRTTIGGSTMPPAGADALPTDQRLRSLENAVGALGAAIAVIVDRLEAGDRNE